MAKNEPSSASAVISLLPRKAFWVEECFLAPLSEVSLATPASSWVCETESGEQLQCRFSPPMAQDSCKKANVIFIEAVGISSLPGDLQYHVTQCRVLTGNYYLRRAEMAFLTLFAAFVSLLLSSLAFSCSFLSCRTA